LLELVGQGQAAIHLFPKQFPTTSMHRIGAVMEVAGLVTEGVTDAAPIVWRKGASHQSGGRRYQPTVAMWRIKSMHLQL
jgi:hypothetical protein